MGSFRTRNWTWVPCTSKWILNLWTTKKNKKTVKVKVAQLCPTLCDPMDYTAHGILQARNTGVGSLSLLQAIFPTQGLNPGLPHCRLIIYQLSHKRGPRILEWVAYPFSSGPSWLRNRTGVFCIAGRFCTNWAIREALSVQSSVMSDSATPWIAACQASLSITNSQSSLKLMSIESVMPSSHLILCHPLLLLPPIPPSIRVFFSESTLRMAKVLEFQL